MIININIDFFSVFCYNYKKRLRSFLPPPDREVGSMEKTHLFFRALALLLSIVTGFFGGLLPHKADRYYTVSEITDYTTVAETAYPNGMIIAIGGKFDTDDTFRPILVRPNGQL